MGVATCDYEKFYFGMTTFLKYRQFFKPYWHEIAIYWSFMPHNDKHVGHRPGRHSEKKIIMQKTGETHTHVVY